MIKVLFVAYVIISVVLMGILPVVTEKPKYRAIIYLSVFWPIAFPTAVIMALYEEHNEQ